MENDAEASVELSMNELGVLFFATKEMSGRFRLFLEHNDRLLQFRERREFGAHSTSIL